MLLRVCNGPPLIRRQIITLEKDKIWVGFKIKSNETSTVDGLRPTSCRPARSRGLACEIFLVLYALVLGHKFFCAIKKEKLFSFRWAAVPIAQRLAGPGWFFVPLPKGSLGQFLIFSIFVFYKYVIHFLQLFFTFSVIVFFYMNVNHFFFTSELPYKL